MSGHDRSSLLFKFLDELLFKFSTDLLICKRVTVLAVNCEEGEREDGACTLRARLEGEAFDLGKHPQGTEVKAITYSNMQIHQEATKIDLFVIIDI